MKIVKYLPLGLFTLYSGKLLISGASLESALVLAVLAASSFAYEWKSKNKEIEELQNKFKQFEDKLAEQDKASKSLETHIHSLKLSTSMKAVNRF